LLAIYILKEYLKYTFDPIEVHMDNTGLIIEVIKQALKKRKVTYCNLAEHLDLSEAAIKKMFKTGDMSLSRLIKICEIIQISIDSLFDSIKNRPMKRIRFNPKQTDFFLKHPHFFYFYLKLIYEEESTETLAKEFNLTKESIWKYLKALDDLDLIKLSANDKYSYTRGAPIFVDTKGIAGFDDLRKKNIINFIKTIIDESESKSHIRLSSFKLSREKIDELTSELDQLFIKYKKISEVEKVYGPSNLNIVSLLTGLSKSSFIKGIKNI